MLRRLFFVPAVILASTADLSAQQRTVVVVPGYTTQVELDTLGVPYVVAGRPAQVFRALLDAYEALKIPLALVDSAGGRVGTWGYRKTGSMAGRQMSAWLHCGEGMTGPVADQYRISMWIYSTLRPRGTDSTALSTALVAGAANMSGDSRQPLPCTSTGRLEERIRTLIEERLKAGS